MVVAKEDLVGARMRGDGARARSPRLGGIRVMAIDPGGTTGVASAVLSMGGRLDGGGMERMMEDIGKTLKVGQLGTPQEDFAALRLFGEVCWFGPDVLIMEDFRLFPDVPHSPDPAGTLPDRYLARMDLLLYLWSDFGMMVSPVGHVSTSNVVKPPKVFKQMPGERTVVTDSWLRERDLWRTEKRQQGGPHAMDALRHLVVWCRKFEKGKVDL